MVVRIQYLDIGILSDVSGGNFARTGYVDYNGFRLVAVKLCGYAL